MIEAFVSELQQLTEEGGWVFWGLLVLAFGIVSALFSIFSMLQFQGAPVLKSRDWRRLLQHPASSSDQLDQLRQAVPQHRTEGVIQELEQTLFAKLNRRFPFAFVLIGAAPLLGLLGTVSGMFNTFGGMSSSQAQAPVDVISKGVSEALITTQTGLIIGVPSLIICTLLHSYSNRLQSGFEQVRSALTLSVHPSS